MKMRTIVTCALLLCLLAGCSAGRKDNQAKLTRPVPRPPAYPERRMVAPKAELINRAISQIQESSRSNSGYIRAHAIEAAKYLPPELMTEIVLANVEHPASIVRFACFLTAGEMRIGQIRPYAIRSARNSSDKNVQAAAIFALHRMGDTRFSRTLEQLAVDADRRVRANTAMLLGLLGEPSATRVLNRQMRDVDPVVRLQAAEAMWRLRDESALEPLVIATVSRYPDDQMIAALALAAPRNPRVTEHVRGMLTTAYPEVNLVAARAMGMLGSDEGYGVAMEGMKSRDARQRQLAAMAFGAIGRMDAQDMLGKLLEDKDEDVRLAAAAALLQLR